MHMTGDVSETVLRLSAFALVFAVMAGLEWLLPKRERREARWGRWLTNLSIVGCGIAIVRLMGFIAAPLVAVGAAMVAEGRGWGVLNALDWPPWLEIVIALLVLDFAIWFQHWASHKVPLLWRVHQMHHADIDIDVTTALRFHPIEIGLSMLYKVGWVVLLGPAPIAVVLFEVILNACAMFNHSNIDLPPTVDRVLRAAIVTPDMHRVHHSVIRREHDSNYGFNLAIWDRLLRTYTDQPEEGHRDMTVGLKPYQSQDPTRLGWCLLLPFRKRKLP